MRETNHHYYIMSQTPRKAKLKKNLFLIIPSLTISRIVTAPSKYLLHLQLYYGCNMAEFLIFYLYFFVKDLLFRWRVVDIRDACL